MRILAVWAESVNSLQVRANNAPMSEADIHTALKLGIGVSAQGIPDYFAFPRSK